MLRGGEDEGDMGDQGGQGVAEGGVEEGEARDFKIIRGSGKSSRTAVSTADRPAHDQTSLVVFIKARAGRKNLTKLNPEQLSKMMDATGVGAIAFMHASGPECIKVHCKSTGQKELLLKVEAMGDIAVEVSEPKRGYRNEALSQRVAPKINLRGVIKGVSLDVTEAQVRKEAGVLKAVRITKPLNGRLVNTGAMLLVFDENIIERPTYVYLRYFRFAVSDFNPPPTRCYVCQGFGHVAKSCRATKKCCPKCAGNHTAENCTAEQPKCANCGGPHSAAYKGCKHFKEAAAVTTMAANQGLSYAAAVKNRTKDLRREAAASAAERRVAEAAAPSQQQPSSSIATAAGEQGQTGGQGQAGGQHSTHVNCT